MPEGKKRSGAFLVSGTQSTTEHLAALLPPGMFLNIRYVLSTSEARQRAGEPDCGLVFINTPLSDENGVQLARDLVARYPVGVLLLVRADLYEQTAGVVEAEGILMEHLSMTEAHRYIEKQAMDLCKKRRDVAEQIIRAYDSAF